MKMEITYLSGSHTKHRVMYHLVWIPKYRKRILIGKITTRLKTLFEQCAEVNSVHILVQLRPHISVSKAVQLLKGGSSIKMMEEFPELEEFLWGDSFWGDGYFIETVGKVNKKIRDYIINQ